MVFETAIIERYKQRESSVEEALMEMYLASVSIRRVKDITQAYRAWHCRLSGIMGRCGAVRGICSIISLTFTRKIDKLISGYIVGFREKQVGIFFLLFKLFPSLD